MTQRSKIDLEINRPTTLTLLYDEPVSGTGKYGSAYHLYAVALDDDEYSFFATEEVHEKIKNLRRGDTFKITKLSSRDGNKVITTHEVEILDKETGFISSNERDVSPKPHDNFFYTMLNSYRDALEISRELNGLVDVHRCSITLYLSRCKQNNY